VTRHLADICSWRVPRKWSRDHHENWKFAYFFARKKFTDSKNAILFDLRLKITNLSRKTRFRAVALPGACERLAVLNWRSSSIGLHPSSYTARSCRSVCLSVGPPYYSQSAVFASPLNAFFISIIFIPVKEVMFSSAFICWLFLFVSRITQKL